MSPLTVRENAGGHIDPVEAGVYVGVCYGLIDLGTQENKVFGGEAHKVLVQWELPECRGTFEKDGEEQDLPRVISTKYTLSLSEKANLRKDLESWRGRKFTADELQGFDLKAILGAPCQLQVVHETSRDGRTFANVAAIMALPKGTPRPEKPENPLAFFSFEEAGDKPEIPEVPDWVRNIITESKEWRELMSGVPAEAQTETDAGPAEPRTDEEDNIPF
ncbi:phage replication initiation protein, NGO0469 family [Verrucomicrobiota bacterium]